MSSIKPEDVLVDTSIAAYVRKLEEEGKNLRARLQTAEQQLGQAREEVKRLTDALESSNMGRAVVHWMRAYDSIKASDDNDENCQILRIPKNLIPKGATLVEAYETAKQFVIIGTPESDDESHNCDAMGCSTLSHVVARVNKGTATPLDGCGKGRRDKELTLDERLRLPCRHCGGGRASHVGQALACFGGMGTCWTPNDEAASSMGKEGGGMSEVYTTGNMYNKRYWSPEKETRCFIEFWQLKWSEDFVNEKGVMFLSGEIIRVKKKRHLYHSAYGLISKHDDPSNPIEVRKPPTPPHDQS